MGTFSIWHILLIAAVVLVIFGGGGKISGLLGDAGRGLKAFKTGLKDEPAPDEAETPSKP